MKNNPSSLRQVIRKVSRASTVIIPLRAGAPGRLVKGHPPLVIPDRHVVSELAICYAGQMVMVGSSGCHVLGEGHAVVVLPGAWHYESYCRPDLAYRVCWFRINGILVTCDLTFHRNGVFKLVPCATAMEADAARAVGDLAGEADAARPLWKLKSRSLLIEFLVDFKRSVEKLQKPSRQRETDAVHRVLQMVKTRFAEPLRLQSVAREVGLSPNHLGQRIKAATGMTFHRYLNAIRIYRSQLLLRSGGSIKDTAERCGFSDVYYFTKVFTQQCRISPGKFARLR